MSKLKDILKSISVDSKVSAQLYLSKLQEYSENVLAREGLGVDVELDRTLLFIKEILLADIVILGEASTDETTGIIKGISAEREFNDTLNATQASILSNLSTHVEQFNLEDDGAREEVTLLLDGVLVMSGLSVPITTEDGSRGVLAVYYLKDVRISQSKKLFLMSMSNVMSHLIQSRDQLSQVNIKNARSVIDAKREWESTVDALSQLIVVLDENATIIRTNKTIQFWNIGSVDSVIGQHINSIISELSGDNVGNIYSGWDEIWKIFNDYKQIEWESENKLRNQILRFSLRIINRETIETKSIKHHGHAVLIVEDITQSKQAEKKLTQYTNQLETTLARRNRALERLNEKLNAELNEHKKNKSELMRSEKRYAKLFQNSLAGICQIESGHIRFYNDRFYNIFKFPRTYLNDMMFIDLILEPDQVEILTLFSDLKEGIPTENHVVVRAKDVLGSLLWLEVGLEHIKFEKNNCVIVNIIDVTRQKNIEISLRESQRRLQKLSSQLITAQETERKRIALELHDSLGQSLSAVKYSLEDLSRKMSGRASVLYGNHLYDVINKIRSSINETRSMSMDLRPSMLDDLGVISTINWFCREYQGTYDHIQIEKKITLDENEIIDSRKIVIYRIIQEALNNTAKHSGADLVYIKLHKLDADNFQLYISDNGCGIKNLENSSQNYNSIGLGGMQERAELTGGVFKISNNEPSGVLIDVRWPAN